MERSLLLSAALSCGTVLFAQNWTATDINGQQHTLQDYLDQGKTVLVDLSAHWCGPCWAWHNSGIMERLYHDFGPDGTGDLMIFFIDASSQPPSNINLINGIGSGTQGDWTAGTPYPIIGPNGNGGIVGNAYNFSAFPTLFLHCPGSTQAVEIDREATWEQFFASWRSMCPAPFNDNAVDATLLTREDAELCPGDHPTATIYNMGTQALTSATVQLSENGNNMQSVNWTGNLAPWTATDVAFDQVNVSGAQDLTAMISMPNGQADPNPNGDSEDYAFALAPSAETATVQFELRTDNYGEETSWKLFDSYGSVVSQDPPGNYGDNQTYTYWWTLNTNECYRFEIYDLYGDGICCSYGQGYFRMRSNGDIFAEGGQFGGEDAQPFTTGAIVSVEENVLDNGLQLFPNPSDGRVNIDLALDRSGSVEIVVMDVLGAIVHTSNRSIGTGAQQFTLDLGDLANGSYTVQLQNDGMMATRKLTINR